MTTAKVPTVPEGDKTIHIQVDQLKNGLRNVVMFPKGTKVPGKARDIGMREIVTAGNTFWHNPLKIKAGEISKAAKNNTLTEILGGPEGYGVPDKSKLRGSVAAVVAKAADGTPAQDIATDAPHFAGAVEAAKELMPRGGTVAVVTPKSVIKGRNHMATKQALAQITKQAASGDVHGALHLAAQHTKNGLVTDDQVDNAMNLAGPVALKAGFDAIPELHHAIKVFHSAAPEHQNILRPSMLSKLHAMDDLPKAEQHATLQKLIKHGIISPTISKGAFQ